MSLETTGLASMSMYQANLDTAQRCASLLIEEAECLFNFQLDVTRNLCGEAGEQLKEACASAGAGRMPGDWGTLFGFNMQRALDTTLRCMDAAAKAQGELARIGREELTLFNKSWHENLQGLTSAAGTSLVEHLEHSRPRRAA